MLSQNINEKIIKNQNIKDGSVFSDYVVQPAHFKDIEPEVIKENGISWFPEE